MSLPDCYNTNHSSALNKISGRLSEGREFISAFDTSLSVPENSRIAYQNRWYGNTSDRKCNELTRHFANRYFLSEGNFEDLRTYLEKNRGQDFSWINHFYMLLNDIYYRWATTIFMANRYYNGLLEIPRSRFDQELKEQIPESVGDGSLARYGQNLLTAIRDNGLLEGVGKKRMISPSLPVNTLAFMLYTLSDCGIGGADFDDSPLYLSLLKPRDLLVPLFLEGEILNYWEFTGDRDQIRFNINFSCLSKWIKEGLL